MRELIFRSTSTSEDPATTVTNHRYASIQSRMRPEYYIFHRFLISDGDGPYELITQKDHIIQADTTVLHEKHMEFVERVMFELHRRGYAIVVRGPHKTYATSAQTDITYKVAPALHS